MGRPGISRIFDKGSRSVLITANSLGWRRLNFLRHERHLVIEAEKHLVSSPVVLAGVMITTDSGPMLFPQASVCLFYTHAQGRGDEREKSDKNKRYLLSVLLLFNLIHPVHAS